MREERFEIIHVLAVFAEGKSGEYVHRVQPLRFRRKNGEVHRISKIRRVYRDQKGSKLFVHYVVQTEANRFFDIVFDPRLSIWRIVLEVERDMMVDCNP